MAIRPESCRLYDLNVVELLRDTEEYMGVLEVITLVPGLAKCYFEEKLPVTLSHLEASVLLCMGLKLKDIEYIEGRMNIEEEILSLFRRVMMKMYRYLNVILN